MLLEATLELAELCFAFAIVAGPSAEVGAIERAVVAAEEAEVAVWPRARVGHPWSRVVDGRRHAGSARIGLAVPVVVDGGGRIVVVVVVLVGHAWALAISVAPSSGATPRKSRIVRLIDRRAENP